MGFHDAAVAFLDHLHDKSFHLFLHSPHQEHGMAEVVLLRLDGRSH